MTNYSCDRMNIYIHEEYLSIQESNDLFEKIIHNPIHFKNNTITKKGLPSKKRNKTNNKK